MKNVANATNYLDVDTKELFRIYSKDKDNKDVRNILIERHLYLVNLLAKKYINKGVEYEDLYQVGSLALITPHKPTRQSACHWHLRLPVPTD